MRRHPTPSSILVLLALLAATPLALAQGRVTTPKEHLVFDAGDDYTLANYTQLQAYFAKLAQESPRFKVVTIGTTSEGRPMIMAIITSPENHKRLDRYKAISQQLARAEGLTDEQAKALAAEGKAVVWIDGGLHATECVPAQHLFQIAYQMASRTDPETMRILNDVILLLTPVNPDGMELVSNWYMRSPDPKQRSTGGVPRLYNKYAGHDNNRDSYANNLPETEAISRQQFIEWDPQIMYNQHQSGPAGTVLFMAPFRDPFNYNYDPLVPEGIEFVGAAIHSRFIAEGKPGAVQRNAASYSTWFNGGIRTTTGFHNQIGLLSEIIGNPTPVSIPFLPQRLLPDGSQPFPIQPQQDWHQRQSIEYLLTADRAILDLASKFREDFLFRVYRMGKNSIERGSKDTWTLTPKKIQAVQAAIARELGPAAAALQGPGGGDVPQGTGGGRGGTIPLKYYAMLQDPANRDPRGYIIPSDQPDFQTATRFVNALIKSGIVFHRATASFKVAGKTYPAGSYIVKTAQAFRPHILDMFEPQDHPDDIPYPGGPPRPPYDATGWTLAFQMGVEFERILEGFDGPFEKLPLAPIKLAPGTVAPARAVAGYLVSHQANDAFTATNKLLAAKEDVYWLKSPVTVASKTFPTGTLYIPAKPTTRPLLEQIAAETGLNIDAIAVKPTGDALRLKPTRIALWDRYGGSMDSGWIRYLFERVFPTTFDVIYAPALDAGDLNSRYDVIIFPGGAIPAAAQGGGGRGGGGFGGGSQANVPPEYKGQLGNVSVANTIPQLRKFVENGGTILAIGSSTSIGSHLGLPISNALVERLPDGSERRLGSERFYVPGSVLQAAVDTTDPLAYGLGDAVDVFFDNSPTFRLDPDAALKGVRPVAWFANASPLRSGWAWGQGYLDGGVTVVEAQVGKGKVFLFGPEITFRAQPHGTFKFLFNGIYYGSAVPVNLSAVK